ncbi:MAG TPA: 30S ribosomal protein S9 [Patescibacteria group bacterium]
MAKKLIKKNKVVQKVVKKAKPVTAAQTRTQTTQQTEATPFVVPKTKFHEGVGRRKVATARVRLYQGKGEFIVNDVAAGQYFSTVVGAPAIYNKPLEITGQKGEFTIVAKVNGSGKSAQLGAVVHGLARALEKLNPEYRTLLKPEGFLTRDSRMKETRKIGTGGKARRKRQSPKR